MFSFIFFPSLFFSGSTFGVKSQEFDRCQAMRNDKWRVETRFSVRLKKKLISKAETRRVCKNTVHL